MGTPYNPGSRNCISAVLPDSATFLDFGVSQESSLASAKGTGTPKPEFWIALWEITLWTKFFIS